MAFGDVKTEKGQQALNTFLADHSYVEGFAPSKADVDLFNALPKAPASNLVHLARWYRHIASYTKSGGDSAGFPSLSCPLAAGAKTTTQKDDDDDDVDLFGSDNEEDDAEAARLREERVKAYADKKSKKPALIAKSSIVLDVKPWDDETDMKEMEKVVRSIQMDGLIWGASKLVPVGYGINKLQIICVVEDDKVSIDLLTEEIQNFEDFVQSVDIAGHNRGAITYEALKNQLEKHGGLLENLSISIDRWLVPPKPKPPPASLIGKLLAFKPYQLSRPYIRNNYVFLIYLATFVVINFGLFVSRLIQYQDSHIYVRIARGCGQCLNFNCMMILILMLRQSITFLRTRGFGIFLPLDQHIYLHKMTGMVVACFSLIHTFAHLLNFSIMVMNDPVLNAGNYTLTDWLLTAKPGLFGLVHGCANPTGVALILILLIMTLCSQAFVRRGGCFEIFYWTHLLYIPFWLLLIFHGPNFWKWFIIPGLIFIIERIIRFSWMRAERGKTYISSGLLLPSRVTHLVIKRPHHFDFHAGDYVFANVPAIAKYEWHPFTISSAPEQEDYIWLHVRGVGQWTNRLYNYFEIEQERLHNGDIPAVTGNSQNAASPGSNVTVFSSEKTKPTNDQDNKNPIKKLTASIQRTLSNAGSNKANGVRSNSNASYVNESFTMDEQGKVSSLSDTDLNTKTPSGSKDGPVIPSRRIASDKKLQMILYNNKAPLEKSLSMPDIQIKAKNRERLRVLREYMRSESERSFDEVQMRRARLQSLGLAYLSPQNKSLAQSFRYMRHKPTIIAFKTPSLENCEQRDSASSIGSMMVTGRTERDAEEGNSGPGDQRKLSEASPIAIASRSPRPVNYPVGKPLEIYLDGPYGAPSSHIFRAQHAVLIATGIGVTPFASILQSIMHRYWKARHSCPKCKFSWASEIPPTVMNLRKVDFFWINRDQRSFEWFVNLLSQLEIEQAELGGAMERFLEMHMYITSALQKTDMKAVGLQLALDLLHEKEKRDLITGLKTRTNAGRPNWDKVFKQLQDQKKGKVTMFYCGPPQLAKTLRVKCDQYGFNFRKEIF